METSAKRGPKRPWTVVLAIFLAVFAVAAASAQTGSIAGTVRDTADALVPGATVTLIDEASKATRSSTSNGEGYFNFSAVQTGTYSISVKMKNFKSWKVTGIEVHPGDSVTVPKIQLSIGEVVQEVTVSATVAGVTLNSPEHSTLITSADIERLSTVGRDALELVSVLPGFTLNAGSSLTNSGADYTTTSFGSGNVGSFGANGAAPQQGLVNITSDGVQVIDPGDMGGTTANINMDQVQEVKVQTSNFGADEAKGPIVINAVGKSGGASYHGSLYAYGRSHIFNSNDWISNDNPIPVPKAPSRYFYPGGTLGGPVKIPGTNFNANKRLTFWGGFEYYDQLTNANGSFGGPQEAFIPTPAMLAGDFSNATIASALNVNAADLAANCTEPYSVGSAYSDIGGDCFPASGQIDPNGNTVPSTGIIPAGDINPAQATFTSLYPTINRVPQPENGYASDGFNWAKNVMAGNNGFQLHSRVDQNFSDTLKLYGVFGWEKVNTQQPLNNVYYNPPDTIPFPTPLDTYGRSYTASINLTKVFNASTTNELVGSGLYFDQPEQFENPSAAQVTGTPWAAAGYSGGVLKNGTLQLPRIYSYESTGIPNFSMGYVPPGGQYLRKSSWNVTDNLTKVLGTHSIKVGFYYEQTRNNQVTLASEANSDITYDRYASCEPNLLAVPPSGSTITASSLGNTAANFLTGCTGGYNQASFDPSIDMYFNTLEGYATDEWKVNSKLTLTFGIRLSHLPPWTDSHGVGAAVWQPQTLTPGVVYPQTAATTGWPGITWHALNPSVPVAGFGSRPLFYAPRAGLAYDLYGNGKSVFRGGFGVYRSRDSYNVTSPALSVSINLVNQGVTGNYGCTLDQLMNSAKALPCGEDVAGGTFAFQSGTSQIQPGTVSVNADDPKDNEEPVTYNYNFTVDQQLPFSTTFEVAYVGNQSTDLATLQNNYLADASLENQDVVPLGAFFAPNPQTGQVLPASVIASNSQTEAQYRPYPNYTGVYVPHHTNWANYNALQASLNKTRGSLVFGVNYTWSKAMAVRGNYDTGYVGDPINPHHDYGVVSFDRPQSANFTYSYQEGVKFRGNRELGWFLNNWEMSGITKLASGPNLAILNGSTNFGFSASAGYETDATRTTSISIPIGASEWLGSSDYALQPKVTCDPRANLHSAILSGGQVSRQYANGNCFALPEQGTQGWWNLPDVHGPAFFSSDLSIYKDVKLDERQNLQFRASGFNFLNHPISSFNNNNLSALSLTYADPACNTATGVGCLYSQSAALQSLTLENSGFGYTPYKFAVRIVEFGLKYNF